MVEPDFLCLCGPRHWFQKNTGTSTLAKPHRHANKYKGITTVVSAIVAQSFKVILSCWVTLCDISDNPVEKTSVDLYEFKAGLVLALLNLNKLG